MFVTGGLISLVVVFVTGGLISLVVVFVTGGLISLVVVFVTGGSKQNQVISKVLRTDQEIKMNSK